MVQIQEIGSEIHLSSPMIVSLWMYEDLDAQDSLSHTNVEAPKFQRRLLVLPRRWMGKVGIRWFNSQGRLETTWHFGRTGEKSSG